MNEVTQVLLMILGGLALGALIVYRLTHRQPR
jgi:hypothetical protein